MGRKVFVSYKYSDTEVRPLSGNPFTTARTYVDKLDGLLEDADFIYKGEDDGEDLSSLKDATIGSKLGDRIFDSSVTIVLISKGMKEPGVKESDQWIPWEVSYSLQEQSRNGTTSKTNAVLAIVIPDTEGKYDYFIQTNHECGSRTLNTHFLFQILRDNMFNLRDKESNIRHCNGRKIYQGYPSYIHSVKWEDFVNHVEHNMQIAVDIRQNINDYRIIKSITQ